MKKTSWQHVRSHDMKTQRDTGHLGQHVFEEKRYHCLKKTFNRKTHKELQEN